MSTHRPQGDGTAGRGTTDRRAFLVGAAGLGAAIAAHAAGARVLGAQQAQNFAPMQQDAYRPTIRPAKPDATPKLTDDERDALEHKLKCQCTCILDVYTCRTTDFTCEYSPRLHREVLALGEQGKTDPEIIDAFVAKYGEKVLMAPKAQGFNLAGYVVPGIVIALIGALLTWVILRRVRRNAPVPAVASAGPSVPGTPVEGMSDADAERLRRALEEIET